MGLFGFGKKDKPSSAPLAIRDTLFGDMPLGEWPSRSGPAEIPPWSIFVEARGLIAVNKPAEAVERWRKIVAMPELEPRHYLQAWHFLRSNGVEPPQDIAKKLYGVVIEVPMHGGLDLLAAYPDHSARYYNYAGAAVIWEHPDDSLNRAIDKLLEAATEVVQQIGPWEGDRPPPPPKGQLRMSFLTPSGLHFGQGPFEALQADPLGGKTVQLATKLMLALVEKGTQARS